MNLKSKEILSSISPQGIITLESKGTTHDKWFALSDSDKELVERALSKAGTELSEIMKMMEESGLLTKQITEEGK